jgi:putative ubiquitin-RnfH superfamily antitoxin RatB of RatAB toxin-antitoxin module
MMAGELIRVEVAYAPAGEQIVLCVLVPAVATVADAVRLSGILTRHPEIDVNAAAVGVFGRLARLDTPLHDRDRVEIYRPLEADAKAARRKRAGEQVTRRRPQGAR